MIAVMTALDQTAIRNELMIPTVGNHRPLGTIPPQLLNHKQAMEPHLA
jgi:hypothetical protein